MKNQDEPLRSWDWPVINRKSIGRDGGWHYSMYWARGERMYGFEMYIAPRDVEHLPRHFIADRIKRARTFHRRESSREATS